MVWPFSRRREANDPGPSMDKRLDEADREVLMSLVEWVDEETSGYRAVLVEDAVHVHPQGQGSQVPLVVARARKGKLVRLEVREETPRSLVDDVVRTFEKRGLWSFNGVVRTLE